MQNVIVILACVVLYLSLFFDLGLGSSLGLFSSSLMVVSDQRLPYSLIRIAIFTSIFYTPKSVL